MPQGILWCRTAHCGQASCYFVAVVTTCCNSPVDSKPLRPQAYPTPAGCESFRGSARHGGWLPRLRSACSIGVPSGRRKIQGMLVVVSARSEEMATTGMKRLHRDLFRQVAGRAVECDQGQNMILIDRLDQFVGSLSPGKLGGNRNQRNGLAFAVDRT